jgi:hypothetical protein
LFSNFPVAFYEYRYIALSLYCGFVLLSTLLAFWY